MRETGSEKKEVEESVSQYGARRGFLYVEL
jgi:hypothetical protein